MITQREINSFFNILAVLADPEKAQAELKVLADMRASIDADLEKVGKERQEAQNALSDAKTIAGAADYVKKKAAEHDEINAELSKALSAKAAEQSKIAEDQQEINRLLNLREEELNKREQEFAEKLGRYETSYADYLVRNEALRKNEAEYRERMQKLKSIAN